VSSFLTIEQRIAAGSQFTGTNGGSTGTITTVAAALIVHGESFQIRARAKEVFTFVFDKNGDGSVVDSIFSRRVSLVGLAAADAVRDAIVVAVNATPGLALYASNGGAATVDLVNALGGTAGNLAALPDDVADAGFIVSAMAAGVSYSSEPAIIDGMKVYPEAAFGGIFDFDFTLKRLIEGVAVQKPTLWRVERILLETTGAGAYTVSILLPDGTEAVYQTAAGGVILITTPILLTGDERLMLTTAGGALAMYARVTARPSA